MTWSKVEVHGEQLSAMIKSDGMPQNLVNLWEAQFPICNLGITVSTKENSL
jgi:hypothetical protein